MRIVGLACCLLLSGLSFAQERALSTFERLDKNGDGRLSAEEVANERFFKRADRNGDGFLTVAEASAAVAQNRDPRVPASGTESTAPVFPPNAEDAEKKRKLLDQIPNVARRTNRPPNIVLLFSDDLGYADTSTYGSKVIATPNLDQLADQGVRLTNAYVTAASCSPSRAGMMSGRYQQRFGFEFNTSGGAITHRLHRGLDPAAVTIADVLQTAGFRTGMFGKWHLGTQPQFHPHQRGFDEFYGFLAGAHSFFPAKKDEPIHSTIMRGTEPLIEPEYLTDAIAREAVKFIDANASHPFFAYVPFNAVHTPIEATKKYQDRFPEIEDATRRDYYAMTSALDDAMGSIIGALERNRISDKTLVIFLNDNGGPLYTGVQSNGPLKLGKLFLFEGGIRVPMILKYPGVIASGTVYEGMASALDVFPTVCKAAGIDCPSDLRLDGVDLIPYLTGKNQGPPHETLFWSNGPNKAVRHGVWKYVRSGDSKWLYNLSKDIGESKNLIGEEPEKQKQLESLLDVWLDEMKKPAWPSKPRRRKVELDGGVYELNV